MKTNAVELWIHSWEILTNNTFLNLSVVEFDLRGQTNIENVPV